ncbi:MAG: hypothetical protein EB119_08705 [Synechococcaceae bacterium WBB_34_004]|nr:hypothetical protein [Synechococcaceae bacterium WBB_34_004]
MSDFIIQGNGSGAGAFTLQSPNIAGNLTLTAPAADGTNGQALVTNGSGVLSFATVGSGDVVGPASATDNAVVRFDGTTGKLVQNSAVTVADTTGDITGGKFNGLTVTTTTGTLTITNGKTLAASNTLTLAGTDSTTMTFPSTSASIARTDAGQTFTGTQVMTSPRVITSINDTNGNELIGITSTASAVNEITVANAATTANPVISATGGDTNIGITLTPKGTGGVTTANCLAVGGATPSTSGAGITFPATQSPSTDANTLDDYEEGTWTPAIALGGGTSGIGYNFRTGRYRKVGNIVNVNGGFQLNNKGSSTGSLTLTGLPFTVLNYGSYSGFAVSFGLVGSTNLGSLVPYGGTIAGTTTASVYKNNGSGATTDVLDTDLTNSSSFIFSMTYYES